MEHKIEIIQGMCPSKSNNYKVGPHGMYKSAALVAYENNFFMQMKHYRNADIEGYFELHVKVFYQSLRLDLDNALKVILDCLQRGKAIRNDNKCIKIVAEKFLDKTEPRIEFSISRV